MNRQVRLCLVLHNHQPVGNFDSVLQQAYEDSYRPFLDVFEEFENLRISLHTSGPLIEWLDKHHPDYVDRLAQLASMGRIEILGGAFYEPILTMIPPRDRVGQITSYTEWLHRRLGAKIDGMWVPERVWEQSLASEIADAGIRYTVLDDFHFKNAGLLEEQLFGYYTTENDGRVVSVFPGSERLRYTIPFADPHETIDYLRSLSQATPDAIAVFGDDGEKFGTWPDTKIHVYENGWLRRFFQALKDNSDWLITSTLGEAFQRVLPLGKIYIPECSYREMTEWSLPATRQIAFEDLKHRMEGNPNWHELQQFVRGGIWRNFKVRYPETDEMYCRMMGLSNRLDELTAQGFHDRRLDAARTELYRGQCNCAYWHGAFGGIYVPHLRNAIYGHLIAAENLLDQVTETSTQWVKADAADLNFDGHDEVRLENEQLVCLLAPHRGGQMYEFDVRAIRHNLLATLARREEAYHQRVRQGQSQSGEDVTSIHDRVVFKQENLDQRLFYDAFGRKSLMDHFYPTSTSLAEIIRGEAPEWGDFITSPYEAVIRRKPDRIQVMLTKVGVVDGVTVKLTKGITLEAGSNDLEIAYMLEGLPQDRILLFGVEMNFAGLPAGEDDRYFYGEDGRRLGQLGQQLDLHDVDMLGLADEWLGIHLELKLGGPTQLWAFPIETVSQSEAGFELVHQSIVVQPHWLVQGDEHGRWFRTMHLKTITRPQEPPPVDSPASLTINQ
jgi:alpha-amylase/alpha-mannosidase (GH57 family)